MGGWQGLGGTLGGGALALAMAGAAAGVMGAEEAARRAPAAMGWQEPGTERVHPGAWGISAVGAAAAAGMVWAWRGDSAAALAIGVAAVLTWHACATDMRDRWLPEHATVPLLLLGLLASPLAGQPSRVDAMALGGALVIAWQVAMAVLGGRRIAWDSFAGGDVVLGAAAGAWLGMGDGQAALGLSAWAILACMTAMPRAGGPARGLRWRLGRIAGYDGRDGTFPVGAHVALGTWVMIAWRSPGW